MTERSNDDRNGCDQTDDDGPTVDPSQQLDPELSASLHGHGFEIVDCEESTILRLRRKQSNVRSFLYRDLALPAGEATRLFQQLESRPQALSDHFGYFSNDGYFELMVSLGTVKRGAFDQFASRSVSRLAATGDRCEHDSFKFQAIDARNYPDLYPRQRLGANELVESLSASIIHVSDSDSGICIELSPQSPCGVLFGLPNYRPGRIQLGFSIKIKLDSNSSAAGFVDRAHGLANSFMYELAVRNRLICEPIGRGAYERDESPRLRDPGINEVRFPASKIDSEVAELYSFAELANDNLPLAFLSFYQVLEYFFPQAVRKDQIRKMRREISDPRFSLHSDADLVRVIGIAEKAGRYKESDQISTLLETAVRAERLREFILQAGYENHFGKRGPISGVRPITIGNQQEILPRQVAERVYQLRNRIVHAKDDPKYIEQKVLLPRSREAMKLKPDVELLRLLAQEVILDSQI
ncbi:hypothetical protein ACWEQD_23700 [Rhodococcus pyridinivorans]